MDLETLTVEQLKALGYDLVLQVNNAQQSLQMIQMELQKRSENVDK